LPEMLKSVSTVQLSIRTLYFHFWGIIHLTRRVRDWFPRSSWNRGLLTHQSSHGNFSERKAKGASSAILETLLSAGPSKSVRLMHDSEGRAIGALIHDHW